MKLENAKRLKNKIIRACKKSPDVIEYISVGLIVSGFIYLQVIKMQFGEKK